MQKRLGIWGSNCCSEVAASNHTTHRLIYRGIHLLAEPAGDARHLETTRPGFRAGRSRQGDHLPQRWPGGMAQVLTNKPWLHRAQKKQSNAPAGLGCGGEPGWGAFFGPAGRRLGRPLDLTCGPVPWVFPIPEQDPDLQRVLLYSSR